MGAGLADQKSTSKSLADTSEPKAAESKGVARTLRFMATMMEGEEQACVTESSRQMIT